MRSRRDPLYAPFLTPEQAAEADRLFQLLSPAARGESRGIAQLLASKPDDKLLGKDRVRGPRPGAQDRSQGHRDRSQRAEKRGYQGSSMSCPTCHGPSKFQDRRDKTFVSLMGQIVLQGRAYYHCPACHAGHVPVDAVLGFSASKLTPGAEEIATLAGTIGSFAEAAEKLLPKMAGLRLSESTVERTTEAAGDGSATCGTAGTPSAPPPTGVGTATRRGGPSPTSASTPRGSASRANAVPRPTAAWSGWARSSTPGPNPPRRSPSRTRRRPATRPG